MSEIYDRLLGFMETQRDIFNEVSTIKPCHVCGEPVTTEDSYVIEAHDSQRVYYIHQKCMRRRKKSADKNGK